MRMPSLLRALAVAAFVAGGCAAPVAHATDDPLLRILQPKDGASACYRRVYDPAHLRRLPRQQTTEALLSFRYRGDKGDRFESIRLIRRAPQPPLTFAGSCEWNPIAANIDTSGNRIIPAFTKTAGYDCIVLTSPTSAEEGGYFIVDLAADGKSAMLYLDSPIAPWLGGRKGDHAVHVDLGPDDQVFRLERTDAAVCAGLENATKSGP